MSKIFLVFAVLASLLFFLPGTQTSQLAQGAVLAQLATDTPTATATLTPTVMVTPSITPSTNGVDLTIEKSASPDPVTRGMPLTYILTVYNSGLYATGANKVRDPLPSGTMFLSAGPNCYFLTGSAWCSVPILQKGQTAHFTFAVMVNPDAPSTITNTAYVDWNKQVTEGNEFNNTATITTSVTP